MKIILIGGKARSGKDTLADFIINKISSDSKKVCKLQVSAYIKYYATHYFGWNGKEETKPRELLNKIGTEIIRDKIDPNFHINRLIQDIKVLSYFYDVFVVSDVRFPVEIERIKKEFDDVTTIKVIRENNELTLEEQNHSTENSLDNYNNFDYVVINDKSLEDLEEEAMKILTEVRC